MRNISSALGKLLFPRLPYDLRQRKINVLYLVVVVGLLAAAGVAFSMLKMHGVGGR